MAADDASGLAAWNPATSLLSYTPALGFGGIDTFQYVVSDSLGAVSGPATVTVNVTALNQAPTTVDDSAGTVRATATLPISVLANDSDPDGPGIDLGSVQVAAETNGTATVEPNGVVLFRGTAPGTGSFTYTVADTLGARSAPATVTVVVSAPPDVPALSRAATFRTTTREWRILGTTNQIVTPGHTITIHIGPTLAGPVLGTATADAAGRWTFRRAASAVVPDQTNRISLESTGGGVLLNQAVTVTR
jgi:hypothetical protein